MTPVILSLGSNLGDRRDHLRRAVAALSVLLAEIHPSSVYETAAVEMVNQDPFLNMVVWGPCPLGPRDLLKTILAYEHNQGRKREIPKGPRVIDLDILFYGDMVIREPGLVIPHPAWKGRRFVVAPLFEILPNFMAPDGSSVGDQKKYLEDSGQSVTCLGPLAGP